MNKVASQFDQAMGRGWRNRYHIFHLNLFLGLAKESPGYNASKVHHLPPRLGTDRFAGTHATTSPSSPSYPSPNSFVHHNRPTELLSSTNPTGGFYTTSSDISRPTSSSYASPVDDSFNQTHSSATSIDLLSTASAPITSMTSRARSESADSVTLCDLCPGTKFTGTPESQKRSLRRHNDEKHSDKPRLMCSRCDATFTPGRSDNLKRHMEQHHRQ